MIWPWIKQVWFHPININRHICTSLDFVIARARSFRRAKNQKQPCRGVPRKRCSEICVYFMNTFS